MQSQYDDIVAEGATVIAISTDDLRGAETAVANFNTEFPILYTAKSPEVPEAYGVFNLFGDGLASASIFLITEGNAIRWQSIGRNYQHQVEPATIIAELQNF